MPKKVMPSESSIIVNYEVHTFDGKFYVEEEEFKKLHEKFVAANNTISYTIDKWFLSIENRMKDQDKRVATLTKYERAVDKVHALEKEIRDLNKTIHELKMEIAKPPYRVMWEGQQVCRYKDFKFNFGNPKPAFEEPLPKETPEGFNDRTGYYSFNK